MKKLSLLIALILCATIGGVYAAWSYAGTDDIADALKEAKIEITGVELSGANGTYTIESNLVLSVDQADDNHYAKLVFESNDGQPIHLTLTFKPASYAPDTVKENAVPTELYFTTTTTMEYKIDANGNYSATGTPTQILEFSNPSDGNFSPNVSWTKQADGSFVYKLNEDDLVSMITLNQNVTKDALGNGLTFRLDTKAEHDAFREALSGNIVARATDGTVN